MIPRMDISIYLKQVMSASVTSTGIQASIPLGGSNVYYLTSDEVDIAYGFTMTCGHADNEVIWDLEDSTLEFGSAGDADTGLVCTETVGANGSPAGVLDVTGTAVPSTATIAALYYEVPAANTGDVDIQATAAKLGYVVLGGGTVTRSALLVPRTSSVGVSVTFDWDTIGDAVNVICFAKSA